eukprot:TRINITY_DN2501_c0_g2_i1.p1 TRINITY_DN2501_c0_g2~~TRINITY_DN2501_c0_g2_i1.p1  ORF type:complete len:1060 (+),score=158.84 TRINITY_DN2501_c0_g2_i1:55-3234(+)
MWSAQQQQHPRGNTSNGGSTNQYVAPSSSAVVPPQSIGLTSSARPPLSTFSQQVGYAIPSTMGSVAATSTNMYASVPQHQQQTQAPVALPPALNPTALQQLTTALQALQAQSQQQSQPQQPQPQPQPQNQSIQQAKAQGYDTLQHLPAASQQGLQRPYDYNNYHQVAQSNTQQQGYSSASYQQMPTGVPTTPSPGFGGGVATMMRPHQTLVPHTSQLVVGGFAAPAAAGPYYNQRASLPAEQQHQSLVQQAVQNLRAAHQAETPYQQQQQQQQPFGARTSSQATTSLSGQQQLQESSRLSGFSAQRPVDVRLPTTPMSNNSRDFSPNRPNRPDSQNSRVTSRNESRTTQFSRLPVPPAPSQNSSSSRSREYSRDREPRDNWESKAVRDTSQSRRSPSPKSSKATSRREREPTARREEPSRDRRPHTSPRREDSGIRSRSRSVERSRTTEIHDKKYDCKISGFSFLDNIRGYIDIKRRYSRLHIAQDFTHAVAPWATASESVLTPVNLANPFQFTIEAVSKVTSPSVGTTTETSIFSGVRYKAKVLLMSGSPKLVSGVHQSTQLKFLVCKRDRNELMCVGGPWSQQLDGGDPRTVQTLQRTVVRFAKEQIGIDLSSVRTWIRFLEVHYQRSASATSTAYTEVTTIFLLDLTTSASWLTMKPEAEETKSPSEKQTRDGDRHREKGKEAEGTQTIQIKTPSIVGTGTKFRAMMISLDGLLDYDEGDKFEATFELSLFAELFHETLQHMYATHILTELQQVHEAKSSSKKKRQRDDSSTTVLPEPKKQKSLVEPKQETVVQPEHAAQDQLATLEPLPAEFPHAEPVRNDETDVCTDRMLVDSISQLGPVAEQAQPTCISTSPEEPTAALGAVAAATTSTATAIQQKDNPEDAGAAEIEEVAAVEEAEENSYQEEIENEEHERNEAEEEVEEEETFTLTDTQEDHTTDSMAAETNLSSLTPDIHPHFVALPSQHHQDDLAILSTQPSVVTESETPAAPVPHPVLPADLTTEPHAEIQPESQVLATIQEPVTPASLVCSYPSLPWVSKRCVGSPVVCVAGFLCSV